jgi:hypothetical protein
MERHQVVDLGNGLHIWGVAVNTFNKQVVLQLGSLAWGYQLPTVKNKLVTKYHKGPRIWVDSLDRQPKLKKRYMRFGTWNVRSMYRVISSGE